MSLGYHWGSLGHGLWPHSELSFDRAEHTLEGAWETHVIPTLMVGQVAKAEGTGLPNRHHISQVLPISCVFLFLVWQEG